MQVKFLKSVVENLINKSAIPIVDLLVGKKDVNEFLIAKKLNLTINQTRNILYKLSDYGLVSFIRKKDRKKGWYIYFWTLNVYQSLNLLEESLKKQLEQLEFQLKSRKERRYYICNTCSIETGEETALLNDFVCQECDQVYSLSDNSDAINNLTKEIARVQKEIESVTFEKQMEGDKVEKKKNKKIKKAEEIKRRARKISAKKTVKPPVKKAVRKFSLKSHKRPVKKNIPPNKISRKKSGFKKTSKNKHSRSKKGRR